MRLPRFHIMHRPELLCSEAGRARKGEGRRQAGTGPDQHGIQAAAGGREGHPAQQVCRNSGGETRHAGEGKVAGVQDMQVHNGGHCFRRHRQRRTTKGLHRADLPGTPSEETDYEARCESQSRSGEAPPRGSTGERNRDSGPASHRRRRPGAADEARPCLCCGTVAPVA